MWSCYFQNTDALIYVVDSSDKDSLQKAKDELSYILSFN